MDQDQTANTENAPGQAHQCGSGAPFDEPQPQCADPLETSPLGRFSFGSALMRMKTGSKLSRAGWNGAGMYVAMQYPDIEGDNKNTREYLYIVDVDGERVPWLASQTDMLAMDWQLGVSQGRMLGKPSKVATGGAA